MSQKLTVVATSRRCGSLPEPSGPTEVDNAVKAFLERVFATAAPQKPDLIVLPEMCDMPEGWSMAAYMTYLAGRGSAVWDFVCKNAQNLNAWIAFCTIRPTEKGKYRNSCFLLNRAGKVVAVFDKMHPTLGELELGVEPGNRCFVAECELGRVGCAICFDLNYIEMAHLYAQQSLDLLLFPSLFHGGLLQKAWAYTARTHLLAACGGCGASVISPLGQVLARSTEYCPELVYTLNTDCVPVHLDFNVEKLRRATEKYGRGVTVYDPGQLATVLVTSETEQRTARQILQEFEIEPLNSYLNRAKRAINNEKTE